jgi:hypothetical protein
VGNKKKITQPKERNNPSRKKKKKEKKNVIMHIGNPAFFTLEYHCSPHPPFSCSPASIFPSHAKLKIGWPDPAISP